MLKSENYFTPTHEVPTDWDEPEVVLSGATVYHGSATGDITELNVAENATVGQGVYFTDNPVRAVEYAHRRVRGSGNEIPSPHLYTAETAQDLRIANLDNPEKLAEVMNGFRDVLLERMKTAEDWYENMACGKALEQIDVGIRVGGVQLATYNHPELFTKYMQGLGYKGLAAAEGGEGGDQVGPHRTILIFDPKDATVKEVSPL